MIKVILSIDKTIIASTDYVKLNPIATSTAREFNFNACNFIDNFKIDNLLFKKITLNVSFSVKYNQSGAGFEEMYLTILDAKIMPQNRMWIRALVSSANDYEYRQGVLDVLNLWESGEDVIWNSKGMSHEMKGDYINACLYYTSVSSIIEKKSSYIFDFSKILDCEDFLYYAGVEFVGEKGYMGHGLYTFEDCLRILHKNGVDFSECQLTLLNTEKFHSSDFGEYYVKYIYPLFVKYGFQIQLG